MPFSIFDFGAINGEHPILGPSNGIIGVDVSPPYKNWLYSAVASNFTSGSILCSNTVITSANENASFKVNCFLNWFSNDDQLSGIIAHIDVLAHELLLIGTGICAVLVVAFTKLLVKYFP